MENKCIVSGCFSNLNTLFIPPANPELLKRWQKVLDITCTDFFVCERHFRPDKDVLIEKQLEDDAVPCINIDGFKIELGDSEKCGVCLQTGIPSLIKSSKDQQKLFQKITNFEPLTDQICKKCSFGLNKYKEFKTEITLKHNQLRELATKEVAEAEEKLSEEDKKEFESKESEEEERANDEESKRRSILKCDSHDCNFKTFNKGFFLWHKKEFHSIFCSYCTYRCTDKTKLTDHISKHHLEKSQRKVDPILVCNLCHTKFYDPKMFVHHKRLAHNHVCQICNHRCSSSDSLIFHTKTVHSKYSSKKITETTSKDSSVQNETTFHQPINTQTILTPDDCTTHASSSESGLKILNVGTLQPSKGIQENTLHISNICNGNQAEKIINSTTPNGATEVQNLLVGKRKLPTIEDASKRLKICNVMTDEEVKDPLEPDKASEIKKPRKKITPQRPYIEQSIIAPQESNSQDHVKKPKKKITPQRPPLDPSQSEKIAEIKKSKKKFTPKRPRLDLIDEEMSNKASKLLPVRQNKIMEDDEEQIIATEISDDDEMPAAEVFSDVLYYVPENGGKSKKNERKCQKFDQNHES